MSSNAYPEAPPFSWSKPPHRPLLPIYPPPEPLPLPAVPSPARKPIFVSDVPYTLTTHIFPAAYLRSTRLDPEPERPPDWQIFPKVERRKWVDETSRALKSAYSPQKTGTDGHPRVLWNCANRYVKNGLNEANRTGLTLFLAHANGFPKEIWEVTLDYLLSSPAASIIDEVWSWESVQHGDAGLINAPYASARFDWSDNARDITNFLLHFLPSSASATTLPTHLRRVSLRETDIRLTEGFQHRKFVAIGHSYGGCTASLAATLHPHLFTSLILVDPVIIIPRGPPLAAESIDMLIAGALTRREEWNSREEARQSFVKSPFFRAWHPAVLDTYIECGLTNAIDHDKGSNRQSKVVKLKMSGMQEAAIFASQTLGTPLVVFDLLSRLPTRIPIRWIMPGKEGASEIGGPGANEKKVWLRRENVSNTRIAGAGHLIVQEAPRELAEDLEKYLLDLFSTSASTPQVVSSVKANL